MKLFQIRGKLPVKAGDAALEFDQGVEDAKREGKRITLPYDSMAEYYPLRKKSQFLFYIGPRPQHEMARVWFGGTEEQPFLVRLTTDPFNAFVRGGEASFFAALKPAVISGFEEITGVPSIRQGDIFAIRLGNVSWNSFREVFQYVFKSFVSCDISCVTPVPKKARWLRLFGTRHIITGMAVSQPPLAEGTLEAPDHAPVVLKGIHLLAQAQGLWDPRRAD